MSGSDCKVLKREPLDPKDAKWTQLELVTYTDPHGTTRDWECASRPTRPASSDIDGVGIAAILQLPAGFDATRGSPLVKQVRSQGPSLLLQKQFRPPVGRVCIELPSGLIDPNETPEQCALRELKEETGYVGQIVGGGFGTSPVMFNDPGFCTTNLRMIHMTIDLSLPENQNPQPQLEENEFIECFAVPLTDLYRECERLEEEGCSIDARVGNLAEGVELAKKWNLI